MPCIISFSQVAPLAAASCAPECLRECTVTLSASGRDSAVKRTSIYELSFGAVRGTPGESMRAGSNQVGPFVCIEPRPQQDNI